MEFGMSRLRQRQYLMFFSMLMTLIISLCGCHMWVQDEAAIPSTMNPQTRSAGKSSIGAREAIDLEIYFVDRVQSSPLIGKQFWNSLHEIGSVDAVAREHLKKDGFRFAMSPARPTSQLQALMGLSGSDNPAQRAIFQQYSLPSGQETLLVSSQVPTGTEFTVQRGDHEKTFEVNDGQCLFRLKAERTEDGWVRIGIVPELRHGHHALRPKATNEEWVYDESQETMTFYENRLTADLNVGEILVMGLQDDPDPSLAEHFFRSDQDGTIERIMLIRVVNIREVAAVRVNQNQR